jgi:hypothetical protein
MTEAELSDSVVELAHLFGWRVAHFRPARTAGGWRTPVSADGAGWPDLTMVRGSRLVFCELKSRSGKLSDGQQVWLDVLSAVGEVHVWRPEHWTDGTIERVLRGEP